jgi:putative peptide zinc metalloprotease protein
MNASVALPALRQNLQLLPGSPDEDGAPRWLLFDVVRNRYYTISRLTLDLIRHWTAGIELEAYLDRLAKQRIDVDADEVLALLDFLRANNLIETRSAQGSEHIHRQYLAGKPGLWTWLLHNYLFFRIPLFRPDAWLTRWAPRLDWLFGRQALWVMLTLGLAGGLMVLRDWDRFLSTFMHFFSMEGMLWYGLALVAVKSIHELGHAFEAKRQGCRVASIGLAFLVMMPVLYTDTTDAWRLSSRRSRLRIAIAGVRLELYIAMLATFLWNLLPDGPWRSVAFFLATTSWMASLLVNISPFLRFDGYYVLSDLLGVENLQQRAFALGRWQLRRLLFGLDDPVPEPLPHHRARLLIAYAWATWIYRLFLFLGIALLVYHFFFKVLGIFLFVVEMLWFVVLPIWRELVQWRKRSADFRLQGVRRLAWIGGGLILLWMLLPLRTSVEMPAVLQAAQVRTVFAPEVAMVESVTVRDGDAVQPGHVMLRLRSPELEREQREVEQELALARTHLSRIASSQQDKAMIGVTMNRISRLEQREAGIRERMVRLTVVAPFAGRVRSGESLHKGRWVNPAMPLMSVVDPSALKLMGMTGEQSLKVLEPGQEGVYIADRTDGPRLPVRLDAIDISAAIELPFPELGSRYGGHLPVRSVGEARLVPDGAYYRVNFSTHEIDANAGQMREPGVIVVQGARRSWLLSALRQMMAVLVREAGL